MSLSNQKHLFNLSEEVTYLNGAYMSPQLKSVEEIGVTHLQRKSNPSQITAEDFFAEKEVLRERFAKLINVDDSQRIAIIPSVSFGMGTAVKNISFERGDEIVVLHEQFPSNYYVWKQLEWEKGVVIKTVYPPAVSPGRGQQWNETILNAISSRTKCVTLPHVHWADGTKFDLIALRKRTHEVGAYLIIDGTQSIGALPFSVKEIQPDAVICAGYKWLMGPYGLGLSYFGPRFDQGIPLDNNWMNHEGAANFSNLVNYNTAFKPKAARFDVGESSNFILVPMLSEAIRQVLEWKPQNVQKYCAEIIQPSLEKLVSMGYFVEKSKDRAHHLFGIYLPRETDAEALKSRISGIQIYVSYRGQALRVAPHVYNSTDDLEKLVSCFI